METKTCTKCRNTFPLTFFNRNGISKSGTTKIQAICRECHREYCRGYGQKNKERLKDTERKRYHQEKGKFAARNSVRRALVEGKLTKPETCRLNNENCSGTLQAHHDDYSAELDVTWYCRKHHEAWHRVFVADSNRD